MNTIDLHSDVSAEDVAMANKLLEFMDTGYVESSMNSHEIVKNDDDEIEEEDSINILKAMVSRWLVLDKEIHVLNDELKTKKNEKQQLETKVIDYMNQVDQDRIAMKESGDIILKKEKESKETINEEYIRKCLMETLNSVEKADAITKMIVEGRSVKNSQVLEKMDKSKKPLPKAKGKK